MKEIERKFLVDKEAFADVALRYGLPSNTIRQGYLFDTDKGIMRVRSIDAQYYIAYKSTTKGITRTEIEFQIEDMHGADLMKQCGPILTKRRFKDNLNRRSSGHDYDNKRANIWEIDIFYSPGLENIIVAEIELNSEEQEYLDPGYLIKEVSDDPFYFNSNLINRIKET